MSYYLLTSQNSHAPRRSNGKRGWYYPSRNRRLTLIVMHCTAGLEDLDMRGPDDSAERTARYAATTNRAVSWHSGSDSDGVVELLPPDHTAFHCKGFNSGSYGHEISKSDMTWRDEPKDWVEATLLHAASHLGPMAKAHGIPLRMIKAHEAKAAYDRQIPSLGGFVSHSELDPSRRRDPGLDFPWKRFFELCKTFTEPIKEYRMLFRIEGGRTVYVTNGATKSSIPSATVFEAMGYKWSDVKDIPASHPLAKLRDV